MMRRALSRSFEGWSLIMCRKDIAMAISGPSNAQWLSSLNCTWAGSGQPSAFRLYPSKFKYDTVTAASKRHESLTMLASADARTK